MAFDGGGSNPMTLQFLSNVLSQRGPSALPYSEDVKWLIRQHLISLSIAFPSLQPKTATFTHNDGTTVNLLQADGTIPMDYQGVTYNIPVIIWLVESYPRHPPCVYVNPTRGMIIKRPHQHVNPSGLVSIPHLQNWIYPSSNLVDLARDLGSYFSRDPPLYSQRASKSNPNPNPSFGAISSRGYSPPPQTQRPMSTAQLVDKAHGDIAALTKTMEEEMDTLFNLQHVLRQREIQIDRGLKEMQDEKASLEQHLQMVLSDCDVLEGWLRDNKGGIENVESLDVDDVFEPFDLLSKQMMECTYSDLAIEDVIYALDKAVQDGVIPFDLYLRNIRLLSREQFFHKATEAKVRAAQMQAQVASMAARASQHAR